MPGHGDAVVRQLERRLEQTQFVACREVRGNPAIDGQHQVAARHDLRRQEEIRHGHGDPPAAAKLRERAIDHAWHAAAVGHQDVVERHIGIERRRVRQARMIPPYQPGKTLLQQRRAMLDHAQRPGRPDREIDHAGRQPLLQPLVDREDVERHLGVVAGQLAEQWQQDHQHRGVGRCDLEALLVPARIELARRIQRALDVRHQPMDLALQPLGAGRKDQAVAAPDQERIVERGAQAAQGGADGGLAEIETRAGGCDAALCQQDIEHPQQIEVEPAQIHPLDTAYSDY